MSMSAAAIDQTLKRAMGAIQSQRAEEAARLAQEVLKAEPRQPRALHLFGYAMLMQERPGEALDPLEAAFKALRDPDIETQIAIALRKLGRTDDALSRLTRAAKRKPVFPAAIHELAFTLHSLGRDDEAIEALARGIEAAPMMVELPLLMGWIYYDRGDAEKAKAAFARVGAINPNHPDAHYGTGLALIDSGDIAAAAERFRAALRIDPSDQQSRLRLGACLLELGDTAAASSCLRLATRGGADFYGKALKTLVTSNRGRFWLQPSGVAKFFKGERN
jgi:tetratricopeptide (TPR) repeat protein